MSMDEMVFGLAMVKEYAEQVNMGNTEKANEIKMRAIQKVN